MPRFDRYLLSQLLALFGFFSLVLVAVYWVNRAVGLFDQLIGDGQSALVFVEFSLLTLPNVIRMVLPVSAFAACLYAINRLMQESELVVMQATGFSTFRLARPVIYFGLVVMMMQLCLTNFLVPLSQTRLAERTAEVSENITARFLNEGRFMHPTEGVTIYIRQISQLGELNDLFLADAREPGVESIYTARQALIVRTPQGPRLVMLDGMAQVLAENGRRRISVTRFADFTLDLSEILRSGTARPMGLREYDTASLLLDPERVEAATSARPGAVREEGHSRLAAPILGLAAPLLGFAALMLGAFSRFGLWRQMALGVILIILLQMANTAASSAALNSPHGWIGLYLVPLGGIGLALLLMQWSQRPRRRCAAPLAPQSPQGPQSPQTSAEGR